MVSGAASRMPTALLNVTPIGDGRDGRDGSGTSSGISPGSDGGGDVAASPAQIARCLGRICCTVMTLETPASVRLFLSRLFSLDAVGCVDLGSMDLPSLETFLSGLKSFLSAMDKNQDVYLQDGLKYPYPAKFTRKKSQLQRKKDNLIAIRLHINR